MSGLTRNEIESIDGLLARVEAPDLYAWLQVDPATNVESLEASLKERRAWAQQRQASAKNKDEARWVIRNYELLQRILLEQGAAYRDVLRRTRLRDAEGLLGTLIRGALASGRLTSAAESLIRQKGRELGLGEDDIGWLIDEGLWETGAARADELESQEHIIELTDTARGAALQGMLDPSTVSRIRRRGIGLGLRGETVDGIIEVARERAARSTSSLGSSDSPADESFGTALRGVEVSRKLDGAALEQIRQDGRARTTEMNTDTSVERSLSRNPVGDNAFEQLVRRAWDASQAGTLDSAGIQKLVAEWSNRGIPESVVGHVIAQVLEQGDDNRLAEADPFAALETVPTTDPEGLRLAFRERYRWAREIADKRRSTDEITRLEEALRRAQDPQVRRRYIDLYQRRAAAEAEASRAAALEEARKLSTSDGGCATHPASTDTEPDLDRQPAVAASSAAHPPATEEPEVALSTGTPPPIKMMPPPPPPGMSAARSVVPSIDQSHSSATAADPRPSVNTIPTAQTPAAAHFSHRLGESATLNEPAPAATARQGLDSTMHWWLPVATFLVGGALAAATVLVLLATDVLHPPPASNMTQASIPFEPATTP